MNKIYWERNSSGSVITISSELAGINGVTIENPGLTINVTTSSDSGVYTCVAENSYGIGKSIPTKLNINGGDFLTFLRLFIYILGIHLFS